MASTTALKPRAGYPNSWRRAGSLPDGILPLFPKHDKKMYRPLAGVAVAATLSAQTLSEVDISAVTQNLATGAQQRYLSHYCIALKTLPAKRVYIAGSSGHALNRY
jgi:hypothetical protein